MDDGMSSLPTSLAQREAARLLATVLLENKKYPLSRDAVAIFIERASGASERDARRLSLFLLVLAVAVAEYADADAWTLDLMRSARKHLAAGE
jgi:hypothetical protein